MAYTALWLQRPVGQELSAFSLQARACLVIQVLHPQVARLPNKKRESSRAPTGGAES